MNKAFQSVKNQLRKFLPIPSPVWWANFGPASRRVAHSKPPVAPPILVISLPRSGSSWVGDVLGMAENALYLREPITQTYIRFNSSGRSFFEVNPATLPRTYQASADSAFAGLPAFTRGIVKYSQQWRLSERPRRRVVIKEVNPLALDWLLERYRPRIVYLVRHPAAVANSFFVQDWTAGKQFESRFSQPTLESQNFECERFAHSFWAEHGALQAVVLRRTLNLLEGYQDHTIVKYEDLCANPQQVFSRLFDFCGLTWDTEMETEIQKRSSSSKKQRAGRSDLERNSAAMITKWKTEVAQESLDQLKEGYLHYDPSYYGPEEW